MPYRVDICFTSSTPPLAIHDKMEVIYIHIFHYIIITVIFWNGPPRFRIQGGGGFPESDGGGGLTEILVSNILQL